MLWIRHQIFIQNERLRYLSWIRLIPGLLFLLQFLSILSLYIFFELSLSFIRHFFLAERMGWIRRSDWQIVFSINKLASFLNQPVRSVGATFFYIPEEFLFKPLSERLFRVLALFGI